MSDPIPAKPRWLDFIPAITLALVVSGSLTVGGSYITQLKENTRRIDAVEADVKVMRSADARLARIEAKLEMLTAAQPSSRSEHPR